MRNNLMLNGVGVENGITETENLNVENACDDIIIKKRWKKGMTTKYCPKCFTVKPIGNFFKRTFPREGYQTYCKTCHNNRQKILRKDDQKWKLHTNEVSLKYKKKNKEKVKIWDKKSQLKSKFGISLSQFNEMVEKQNHKCAICENSFLNFKICVDHNHKTNKVRQLLCSQCNFGLGHFRENPQFLLNAVDYLNKWNSL